MTLLDAQDYDPEKARKRKIRIIAVISLTLVIAFVVWWNRYWPQKHIVGNFFEALQKKDYNTAYGIWMHDPAWQQHPVEHKKYPFNEFYQDWGPGGQWGLIKTQKVNGASTCPDKDGSGSGIVVDVIVNDRAEHAQVWVENSDHTLSYPPCELLFP
jgi:hypothetical protein